MYYNFDYSHERCSDPSSSQLSKRYWRSALTFAEADECGKHKSWDKSRAETIVMIVPLIGFPDCFVRSNFENKLFFEHGGTER